MHQKIIQELYPLYPLALPLSIITTLLPTMPCLPELSGPDLIVSNLASLILRSNFSSRL